MDTGDDYTRPKGDTRGLFPKVIHCANCGDSAQAHGVDSQNVEGTACHVTLCDCSEFVAPR